MQLAEVRIEDLVFIVDLDEMTTRARLLRPGKGWVEVSLTGQEVNKLAHDDLDVQALRRRLARERDHRRSGEQERRP